MTVVPSLGLVGQFVIFGFSGQPLIFTHVWIESSTDLKHMNFGVPLPGPPNGTNLSAVP